MENIYYTLIIGALLLEYALSTVSSVLNMNNISKDVPDEFKEYYDEEKYSKSQSYLKEKTKFGLISSSLNLIVMILIIHYALFGNLDDFVRSNSDNSIIAGLMFFGIIFFISDVINIPFSVYNTFVIEEEYGFNKTTFSTYISDKFKGYGLAVVLGTAVIVPFLYFFENYRENGWWIAWLLVTCFIIAIQPLFVNVIAPMFNTFEPLEKGELRNKIEEFSNKVKFPISRIDVMDGSRRSAHSNAYFSGFGKSRRIALFDTLLEKHTTEEIVSVVAHEVGHYKKKHIIFATSLGILETGLMLFIFNFFLNDIALFRVFGVENTSVYCGLIFFGMLYSPVSLFTSIFTTALSRKNEFEADAYALRTTKKSKPLISLLKGLAASNLSHLTPHPLMVFLSYSHPPVPERISAIRAQEALL